MTDLIKGNPAALERLRRVYPAAIGYGHAYGARFQLMASLRKRERRGEIQPIWKKLRERNGVIDVPFVYLMTERQVRARLVKRTAVIGTGTLVVLAGVGWLVWESLGVISVAGMIALVMYLLLRFGGHPRGGCCLLLMCKLHGR